MRTDRHRGAAPPSALLTRRELLARAGLIGGSLSLAQILAACSNSSSSTTPVAPPTSGAAAGPATGSVSVLAYEDGLVPGVLGPFEKANPDLSVKTAAFNADNEAITKMQAGFNVDLVNSCTENAPRMYSLGLIQPIDTSRLTDWNSLFPAITALDGVAQDGNVIMIPETGGTSGIVYNPKAVPGGVTSWTQLFEDASLAGKVTMEDEPLSGIPSAAFALGHADPWTLTSDDLAAIKQYYVDHASQFRTFFGGDADFINLYRSGEIVAGFGYHDYQFTLTRQSIPVEFVHPQQGWLIWECGYSIGAHAPNLDNAYALLNWYTSAEPQAWYAKNYTYVISDQNALQGLPKSLISGLGLNDPTHTFEGGLALQIPDNYPDWLSTWREIKAAMS